jgi:hypothetical protein
MFRRIFFALAILALTAGAASTLSTVAHAGGTSGGVNGDRHGP